MSAILDGLASCLALGNLTVGQVECRSDFSLRHEEDSTAEDLERFTTPEAAIAIARFDSKGNYRPLKAAPNLKRGWEIRLASLSDTRLALDFFYPAALGIAFALQRGTLAPNDLRETLGRQTGMYAVTKKITDEEAQKIILETCDDTTRCRNRILWNIAPGMPTPLTQTFSDALEEPVPLICTEACPLLVAAARTILKSRKAEETAARV